MPQQLYFSGASATFCMLSLAAAAASSAAFAAASAAFCASMFSSAAALTAVESAVDCVSPVALPPHDANDRAAKATAMNTNFFICFYLFKLIIRFLKTGAKVLCCPIWCHRHDSFFCCPPAFGLRFALLACLCGRQGACRQGKIGRGSLCSVLCLHYLCRRMKERKTF